MENPQLENGYIRIAMEIFEALAKIRISGEARQVLDVIIRKTYGFQKREDRISLSQFALATGISKIGIRKAINKLISMKLVVTKKGNDYINTYRFNKDFNSWKPLPKKVTVTKKGIQRYQKSYILTKDTTTIDREKQGFTPPSLQAIKDYIQKNKYTIDAEVFYKFFTESGWVDSKGQKVKNWKQKVITWASHQQDKPQRSGTKWKKP